MEPISFPLGCVLSFLQQLMDINLVFSTIKTYDAAISSCHEGFGERMVFNKEVCAEADLCHAHLLLRGT